ncbi:MAG: hypothetical protein NTV54_00120 [Ignavibacteriales bacterium]|nr:hypothetical protein [Ignavibacteriales bacterium]
MADETISFKIDGPIIKDDYPLHEVITILNDFHGLIDQSYLVLSGKTRLNKAERVNYRIIASRSRPGSYLQELKIVYDIAEPFLPLIPQLVSSEIWQSVKTSFEFLKAVFDLRQRGKELSVSAPNNSGLVVVSSPGSEPITVNQTIINIADRSEDLYRKITSNIDKGRIEEITAVDANKQGIILGESEKQMFNPETKLDDNPIDIVGSIFDFNKDKYSGKIRVSGGQSIPSRDYNFELISGQDPIAYILAMTKEFVRMRCLPEIATHTTGIKSIARLQAISINET